jgi:hypothetical protein
MLAREREDMKNPRIAILDDDERRCLTMREHALFVVPYAELHFFDNAPDLIEWFKVELSDLDLISLDHDLGPNRERDGEVFDPGTGRDVVDYLCSCRPVCPVLIHSSNSTAAQGMHFALEDAGWQNERVFPFDDVEWIAGEWRSAVAGKLGE